MKAKVKITYPGPIDESVDNIIIRKLENIGAEWYAQGMDLQTHIRDICFDIEI